MVREGVRADRLRGHHHHRAIPGHAADQRSRDQVLQPDTHPACRSFPATTADAAWADSCHTTAIRNTAPKLDAPGDTPDYTNGLNRNRAWKALGGRVQMAEGSRSLKDIGGACSGALLAVAGVEQLTQLGSLTYGAGLLGGPVPTIAMAAECM